jgi:circadian clock protein KaiC
MTDNRAIQRLATGIRGFDQVALGGLPTGRSTLVTGTTGSGKTLFAVEFLARGILLSGEAGVFVSFEETPDDIRRNAASLGFPIERWEREGKWTFVDASVELAEEPPIVGAFDFGGLLARIEHAIRGIDAVRVSVDSLGVVFTRFAESAIVRHELYRITSALEGLGVTSVHTSERIAEYGAVSRYGVEEFVIDNVVILRNGLMREKRRRTIEIVKLRGAEHRTGEWLFTIDPQDGIVVVTLTFLTAVTRASLDRVSSGNTELDQMCGGGFFRDAVVLMSGPTGSGKTLTGLTFTAAGVTAGERCLFHTFDETRGQLARDANGWNLDLDSMEASGLLRVGCDYPEVASLEDHFLRIRRAIEEFTPSRLVIDTLSALERITQSRALLDFVIALGGVAREHQCTVLFTSASSARLTPQLTLTSQADIASLADVTIILRYLETIGEIQRAIAVLQARGSAHDHSIRRVTIDGAGMHIGERVRGAPLFLDDPQPGG